MHTAAFRQVPVKQEAGTASVDSASEHFSQGDKNKGKQWLRLHGVTGIILNLLLYRDEKNKVQFFNAKPVKLIELPPNESDK